MTLILQLQIPDGRAQTTLLQVDTLNGLCGIPGQGPTAMIPLQDFLAHLREVKPPQAPTRFQTCREAILRECSASPCGIGHLVATLQDFPVPQISQTLLDLQASKEITLLKNSTYLSTSPCG